MNAASIKTSQSFGAIGGTGDMFADRRLIRLELTDSAISTAAGSLVRHVGLFASDVVESL